MAETKNNSAQNSRRQLMQRREFLSGAFKAIGLLGANSLFEKNAWAAAVAFEPALDNQGYQPKLFNAEQMRCLFELTDLVLPKTETPSGVEVGVHQFLDHQLYSCYGEQDQLSVARLLSTLEAAAQRDLQESFSELSVSQKQGLLRKLEQLEGFSEEDKQDFVFLKTLMVFGYFTSEVGATQVLAYQTVPGDFVGSVPYVSLGKAWGSLEFY